jgi:hypothetical protein
LKVEDKDKIAFITPHGVYCYMTMPFGLKNAGATYQRCMQACLKEQIGRNIEVYVEDIIIKMAKADSLLDDLRETFANLDRYSIKLNPKKCSFGVPTGQLLGYLISERGIEGNPEKIQAIINMQPPKMLRHVQQLIGRLAALSRFISKLGEKALPSIGCFGRQTTSRGQKRCKPRSTISSIACRPPQSSSPPERKSQCCYT